MIATMTAAPSTIPLIALDAAVIDTETTGLDPRKARIVEIAAMPIRRGRIEEAAAFRSLVRPDEPIPAASTRIHNIDDAAVADAPSFSGVWPQAEAALTGVLIGHSVGFDLAVLKRECERASLPWQPRATLDTRLLAEVAEPQLAGYSLETLAAWLGIAIEERHSALADARLTARIFLALAPKLREAGVHTFGEAVAACRNLAGSLEDQRRAGWEEPISTPSRVDTERTLARIDSYPFRHRIRDVMSRPAKFIAPETPLSVALTRMVREGTSSLFVATQQEGVAPQAKATGIITERDATRAIAAQGASALEGPVSNIMSRPLAAVPADAFVYIAIGRMARLKIRHLGVVDETGHVIGALSARDLLRLRAGQAVTMGDEVEVANGVGDLAFAWAKLPQIAQSLRAEGLSGREVAAVISRQLGDLTARAAQLAEAGLREQAGRVPPCPYAVGILGSAARGESLLAMDQDNLIVFADGEPDSEADHYFARLGATIADILHSVGVPYCKGGVMAREPAWRGSVGTWQTRIEGWIGRSSPTDLLSVDIFFDLLPVHGDARLAEAIRHRGFERARGHSAFAKLLAEAAGPVEPGLGFFGRFKTENGRIDLKRAGLFGIATTARVLAIRHDIRERSTPDRLSAIKSEVRGGQRDLDSLIEAYGALLELVLDQQIEDVTRGAPPSNRVAVGRLASRDRDRLKRTLEAVRHLDQLMRDLLF